jgi:hypothetical protein
MQKSKPKVKGVEVKNTSWTYAAAPESTDHIEIKSQYELFINGKFVKPNSTKNRRNTSIKRKRVRRAMVSAPDSFLLND